MYVILPLHLPLKHLSGALHWQLYKICRDYHHLSRTHVLFCMCETRVCLAYFSVDCCPIGYENERGRKICECVLLRETGGGISLALPWEQGNTTLGSSLHTFSHYQTPHFPTHTSSSSAPPLPHAVLYVSFFYYSPSGFLTTLFLPTHSPFSPFPSYPLCSRIPPFIQIAKAKNSSWFILFPLELH